MLSPRTRADVVAADEVAADDEGLGQALGARLDGVAERMPELRAVAEQPLERRRVVGRGDDQDVADARQHQRRQRVVDHRLVVDRQQLLGDDAGERVEARPGAAGEDDALHGRVPSRPSSRSTISRTRSGHGCAR